MRDSYQDMESIAAADFKANGILFLALTIAIAASASLAVFIACFYWFRREQRRWQQRLFQALADSLDPCSDHFRLR